METPLEADLCLLICSMFREGFRIPVEDLVRYGIGLELFKDVHDIFGARDRVHHLIEIINNTSPYRVKLRRSKDEYNNHYVEMMDDAYGLATSIALRHQLVFGHETVMKKWRKTGEYKHYFGLSLVLKKISENPVSLKCPKLVVLQLQYGEDSQSLPDSFFKGMKKLRVLSLDIPSLPRSLSVPRSLRMLHLKALNLEGMHVIGGLINLESLSISTFSSTDVPREMGQLGNLRLLDLREMNLSYIPPGVLSKMLKLEELYLPLTFRRWGCRAKEEYDAYDEWEPREEEDDYYNEDRVNASLSEIASLSLNALQIRVQKASLLPKKFTFFKSIRKFKILVQNYLKYQLFGEGSMNKLEFTGHACDIKESGIYDLMSRTEDLSLTRVRNLKNVMNQLEVDGFPHLKKMSITECDELEYIIDTEEKQISCSSFWELESLHLSKLCKLEQIWHGTRPRFGWFEKLRKINIRFCHKLKDVFPLSMARGLRQLQSIEILDCNEMEGIFYKNEGDDNDNDVYSIEELDLHSLPKMIGFLVHKDKTTDGVHDNTNRFLTNNNEIQIQPMIMAFQKLQVLTLLECNNLLYLLSPLIANLLGQLKKIQISRCEKMEEVVKQNGEEEEEATVDKIVFPQLKVLELQHLPNLEVFYGGNCAIELPLLESLKLNQCNKVKFFSYGALNTPILERIQMNGTSYPLMEDVNVTIKWLTAKKL
ncbi:disease resistance protein RPS2-like isoform X2 [Euphorbia lathyris]|uniref:disease resistance protein RPS2-like isoform X2 n=1 Tax=Euphorbia lathyris TaxID=212925 RepID=UPI0033141128